MHPGSIIFLNGTSSAGKTSIAKVLQEVLDAPYLHIGIDHFLQMLPARFFVVSDGSQPTTTDGFLIVRPDAGSNRVTEIQIGPVIYRHLHGWYQAIASLASAGINVIVDDVVFDRQVLLAAIMSLGDCGVLFVGVQCPRETAEQREQERGDRMIGLVPLQYAGVHAHGIYDLEVDTSTASAYECALAIQRRLQSGVAPMAFRKLRDQLAMHP